MSSFRVTSACETPRCSRAMLVSATMKPAMKKNPGATGTPVNRVRNWNRPPKTGDTFTCSATTADGTALAITVIQQDDQGNVTWLPSGILVDMEVYSPANVKVHQQVTTNQSFASGQSRSFQWTWTVPAGQAPGPYTIKIGVFSGNWATLHTWHNSAGSLSIQ